MNDKTEYIWFVDDDSFLTQKTYYEAYEAKDEMIRTVAATVGRWRIAKETANVGIWDAYSYPGFDEPSRHRDQLSLAQAIDLADGDAGFAAALSTQELDELTEDECVQVGDYCNKMKDVWWQILEHEAKEFPEATKQFYQHEGSIPSHEFLDIVEAYKEDRNPDLWVDAILDGVPAEDVLA